MNGQYKVCPECSEPAALAAGQCLRCGHVYRTQFTRSNLPTVMHTQTFQNPQPEITPFTEPEIKRYGRAESFLAGIIGGAGAGAGFIIVGSLLSLTVFGAIIGIPLVLFGIAMIIMTPFFAATTKLEVIKGECPYCGCAVKVSTGRAGLNCPGCRQRIIVKNERLHRLY